MKAAVCREFGQPLVIEEIELAPPQAGEIKVKLAATAICHSDIFYAQGAWGGSLPAVFGHEAAGVVVEAGAGVSHVAVGDHVVVTLIRFCGTCPACAEGGQVFCEAVFPLDAQSPLSKGGERLVHGLRTGAFAEYVVVEASQAVAIDKDVPFDSASLIACGVITGMGAVINTAGVTAGKSVVVIGCGGVGLNSVQGARLAGASPIVAVDLADSKLDAALRFGATHVINGGRSDVSAALLDITGGRKVDYVFVTVGAPKVVEQAIALMKRNGSTVIVGMPASGVMASFDPGWIAADGQRIIGSKMGSSRIRIDIPKIVELYKQGRIKLDELISGRFPLSDINAAIAGVVKGEALRNVIVFPQ
ncbi:MAG: Zn-dependent alcohol dehydrogenase [Alphaproteobacteria bacterium]|nr:Zn-dependent alcohol dehydrogenase [Alphaproteobacteria bacterium]